VLPLSWTPVLPLVCTLVEAVRVVVVGAVRVVVGVRLSLLLFLPDADGGSSSSSPSFRFDCGWVPAEHASVMSRFRRPDVRALLCFESIGALLTGEEAMIGGALKVVRSSVVSEVRSANGWRFPINSRTA